jgi:phenylpropionate dioxygenase-like ring-hydroxylating dioxygenase large terminal subunit
MLGLRNYWYPVLWGRRLGKRPVPITLCGERLVLIRDGGRAYALQDRCAHRGVPLSIHAGPLGNGVSARQVFPGTWTCGYHGWTYDLKTGTLVAALTDGPDSPICGKVRIQSYPVEERLGLLWVYVGEVGPPPVEDDIPQELLTQPHFMGGRISTREGNWRYATENAIDEAHPRFLHREAVWRYFKQPAPAWNRSRLEYPEDGKYLAYIPYDVHREDDYPGLGKWPQQPWYQHGGRNAQQIAIRLPGMIRVRQPGFTIYSWFVPIDAQHHRYVQTAVKTGTGPRLWAFRAYYWLYMRWVNQHMFNSQDAVMIRGMDSPPERLFRPDLSIIGWRMMCEAARGRGKAVASPAAGVGSEAVELAGVNAGSEGRQG